MNILPRTLKFAALAAVAAVATAATHPSWVNTVVRTEAGGHRMGNPQAKVAVLEFVSYTCPHCANFEQQSSAAMQLAYVAPGKASVEVRHVLRNPVDLAAALLAECGPEQKFFANHDAILRSQDKWLQRLSSATKATQDRWNSGPIGDRMRAIASDADLYSVMEKRGYDRVAANKCLSDEAAARRIAQQSEASSNAFNVQGTPSFAINGKLLDDVYSWDGLQKAIASHL